MKKLTHGIYWTLGLAVIVSTALFAARIIDDTLKVGNPSTSSDKIIEFDTGDGTSNSRIAVQDATPATIRMDKSNILRLGRGIAENMDLVNNNAAANKPTIRYNNSSSKWQFSDNGTTFLNMDEETPTSLGGVGLEVGAMHNFRIQAAGTGGAKITSVTGAALSGLNPAIALVKRTGDSGAVALNFESDIQWDTAGLVGTAAADIVGQLDTGAGIALSNEVQMVIHACNMDNTSANAFLMLWKFPRQFTPSSTNDIGYIESAPPVADSNNVWVLKTGITPSNFLSKPCVPIGGVRMTKNTSEVWSVADAVTVGMGRSATQINNYSSYFVDSGTIGHWGAVSGSWFTLANGPSWSSQPSCGSSRPWVYQGNLWKGDVDFRFNTTSCGTVTNGTDGNELRIALPEEVSSVDFNTSATPLNPCGVGTLGGTQQLLYCEVVGQRKYMRVFNASFVSVKNNSFTNGNDDLTIRMRFQQRGR